MKTIIITALILTASIVFCKNIFAEITPAWVKSYNGPGNTQDAGYHVRNDASGNIYVSGRSSESGISIIFLIKYNAAGTQQWIKTFDNQNQNDVLLANMQIDEAGNIYILGIADEKTLVIKYNPSGTMLWSKTYLFGDWGTATGACISSEGNVFVVGNYNSNGGQGAFILKYNSAGVYQWSDTRMVNNLTLAYDIKIDANGNLYSTGVTENNDHKMTMVIMKYNNAGQIQQFYEVPHALLQGVNYQALTEMDAAGNIYLSAETFFTDDLGDSDIWTVKLSPSFQVLWSKRYDGLIGKDDQPFDMCIDNNGSVYVVGQTYTSGLSAMDFVTIKYASTGSMQWDAIYDGSAHDTDYACGLVVDYAGNVYVTGVAQNNSTGLDITTIKYGLLGAKQWETTFSASDFDMPSEISMDNSGNLYITGRAQRFLHDDLDMVLLKYGSTVGIQQISGEVPSKFELSQNYPNPFNPVTNIKFSIPKSGSARLVVFDAAGREVAELVNEDLNAGTYNYDFNALHLSSGVYFYRLVTSDFSGVKKMILIK